MPRESLAVLKVVGSVIRLSIGFTNKWGHRRRHVALSYQHIQNYCLLRDRTTLSKAIRHALKANYIQRVEEGFFDPNAGRLSKAAVYAVKWLNDAGDRGIGQKTPPAELAVADRSETPTGIGPKTLLADRSEKPTGIEIKQRNKTSKQQDHAAAVLERLQKEGFGRQAAQVLASRYPAERIQRQIAWIDQRVVRSNRLGMLRAAIEQDWPAPKDAKLGRPNSDRGSGASFHDALRQAEGRLLGRDNSTA